MELLPEIEYFRDIVFHSKHSVSRKADIPSDVAQDFTWLPHHATLTWTTRPLSIEDNDSLPKNGTRIYRSRCSAYFIWFLKYMRLHPKMAMKQLNRLLGLLQELTLSLVRVVIKRVCSQALGKYCTFDLLRQICLLILTMKTFETHLIGNLNQDKPLKSGCFRFNEYCWNNVQISEFALQNHNMILLTPHILNHKDFQQTRRSALNDATDLACAEVMHTMNRYW
eukprot:scaffold7464_cov267-Chaetoceros_neogracile.AAC.5